MLEPARLPSRVIRRAAEDDITGLVALRRAMWDEMHSAAPAGEAMLLATDRYLHDELAAGRLLGWIAVEKEVPVGMAMLLVQEHPPRITGPEVRGYVTAVFVERAHRRQGHALALLQAIVEHARSQGFRRLMLRTSEDGRRVYESAGFRPLDVLAQDF